MKIAYISGVKFGLVLLEEILKNNFQISIVFSYDDSKQIIYSDYASFDELCERYNIKHIKVQNINDEKNVELLQSIKPDLILVMGWSQLLKNEIIKIPKLGVIGSHPTELPKYRGRAPISWSIIKGLKESALTFFYIEDGVDTGDILAQQKFKISLDDDAASIYHKITDLGKQMIIENLFLLKKGNSKRTKQDNSKFIEYWPKRTPTDGLIDWSKSAMEINVLIRATTHPYPGAFTYYNNSKLKIFTAQYADDQISLPGQILDIESNGVRVGTGNGTILIKKIQLDNEPEIYSQLFFSKNDLGKKLGI